MKRIAFLCFFTLQGMLVAAQQKAMWNGKSCAVVLTYDDALNVHLDNVIPALDSAKLKGTFYLSGYFSGFRQRIADWRKAAATGHEMANHTLFHPCIGQIPGREWVKPESNMGAYSVKRMVDEIRMMNVLLQTLDGKTQRTFAYPCGDTKIGDVAYLDQMKDDFVAARGVTTEFLSLGQINLSNVGAIGINGQSGEELIALVKKAMETKTLLVFLFHGVGGEHSLNVSLEAHRKLVLFLQQNQSQIWVAPFLEVAQFIKASQQENTKGKQIKTASPK
ncbi:polysaccharide deacetylase family protein [Xanthocytophaga flava]|uniref:polysaccharide deacetylase family protein n=1 Tax=Xanthocytophaga flava TaxID=3048013 RepID=UPI0028D3C2AD|nr:polysaccharide deacetylase family protein [Xanthocytophaga flavus]MDJ1466279.1 polysaccharide deacetylase family protein [Xanthocytophaga flavus]